MKSEKLNKEIKMNIGDKKIAFAIIFQFCILITNYAVKSVFQVNDPIIRFYISLFFMLIVGILYLKNIGIVLSRIGLTFMYIYIFFGLIFLISSLAFPENNIYLIEAAFWLFLICLPTAIYYLAINDKAIFLDMLLLSGNFQMILGFIIFVSMVISQTTYDMVFSYLFLVPIIIITYKMFFIKFKIIDLISIILGIIAILLYGARGPLLAYIIFIMLLVLNYFLKSKIKPKDLIIIMIAQTSILLLAINVNLLLNNINKLLLQFGLHSRTLYLLMSENIDFSTGRSGIYEMTLERIFKKPIFGYGITGDRLFLNGAYPHNIFLELLAQFGIVFGGIIIIIFVIIWIKGVFVNKNITENHLGIIFAGIGLITLFYSDSYLTVSNFWLFMAICFSTVHKNEKIYQNNFTEKPLSIKGKY